MELTREQRQRYNRHLVLDGFGAEAQQRLLQSKVLLVGAGGLGSPVALYLAAAGVGTIGIVDGDTVSITNLQRQVLHSTPDVGRPKVEVAKERIIAINPDVKVETYECYLSEQNALDLIRPYDFIIDGTDNFATKYLVNDACVMPGSACYRCLFPEPPAKKDVETCAMVGVLGSIAGMLGTVQATECIKYLAGVGQLLTNSMLTFDALSMQWQRFGFAQRPSCELCGTHPSIHQLKEYAFKPCKSK